MSAKIRGKPTGERAASPFVDRIRETIRRRQMLAGGETIVVAVSGGPDSTALLHGLVAIAPELRLSLRVAHLNHQLRGDSAEDATFVAAASRALGLEHHEGRADPRALARREGLSLEEAARRLRYEFLTRVARDAGATVVATGHTLDDQAETVLIRLLRGAGLNGLAAIPPVRYSGQIRIIRPLIDTMRVEIEAYLRAAGVKWRTDSTNQDLAVLRNRIRLVLVPTLEGYNPDVRRTLARLADLLRDEAEAIDALAARGITEALSGDSASMEVALDPFARLAPALQRRALREAVRRVHGNLRAVQFVHVEGARQLLLTGQIGSWLPLPGGVRITRSPRGAEVTTGSVDRAPSAYRLPVPGRVVAVEFGIQVDAVVTTPERPGAATSEGERAPVERNIIMVDGDLVGSELVLRGPQPGDRFAPVGMGGRTKLVADFLRDERVPRHRRAVAPMLTTRDGVIVWVVGRRQSEFGRITPTTTRAVQIIARPLRA